MGRKFAGVGVALVTPFTKNNTVDYDGLDQLVNHVIRGGVDYLVVLGTTGESVTLTKEEKRKVVAQVINSNARRLPVVIGIGGNNTQELIETINDTDFTGIDAILSASPMYNKPTQEGIYQHYKALAKVAPKPIILYNVPGRTASNIAPDTVIRLANSFNNIIGIKEASGSLEQAMEIYQAMPKGFYLISGDDALAVPFVASGGEGVISVVANALPRTFSAAIHLTLNNDAKAAQKEHYKVFNIINMLFKEGNPGGVKAALQILGVCGADVRLPLWPISDGLYNSLSKALQPFK
jgi:4-hydroxy-tetrahydrodipicolinate synthase